MSTSKNVRVMAELSLNGGSTDADSDTKETNKLPYDETDSPEVSYVNNPQSRTPSPSQVVQAVPTGQLRCFGCGHTIDDTPCLSVLNGIFHENCFRCDACKTLLDVTNYHVVDGKPHCDPPCPEQLNSMILVATTQITKTPPVSNTATTESHDVVYHTVTVSQQQQQKEPQREYCSACGLIIATNLFVRAFDGVFHNECFRCSACNRLLRVGNCKFVDSKLRCDPECFETSLDSPSITERSASAGPLGERAEKTLPMSRYHFTMESKRERNSYSMDLEDRTLNHTLEPSKHACFLCQRPVSLADRLDRLNRTYHRNCFRCHKCHRLLQEHKYNIQEENPCCQPFCGYEGNKSVQPVYVSPSTEAIPGSLIYQNSVEKSESSGRISRGQQTKNEHIYLAQRLTPTSEQVWTIQPRSNSQPESVHCYHCNKNVYAAERINAMNRVYHRTCFRCYVCKNVLNICRFGVYEGKPLCEPHQKQLQNMRSLSAQNLRSDFIDQEFNKPFQEARIEVKPPPSIPATQGVQEQIHISLQPTQPNYQRRINVKDVNKNLGHVMDAPKQKLIHPTTVSRRPVGDTNYTSLETLSDRPTELAPTSVIYAPMYAGEEQQKVKYSTMRSNVRNRPDFTVADGRCFGCGKKVYLAERLVVLERLYHRNCFRCAACNNVLSVGRYSVHDDQPYCIPHHKQLMYLTNSSLRVPKGGVIRDELDGVFTESRAPIVQMTNTNDMPKTMKSGPQTPIVLYRDKMPKAAGEAYIPAKLSEESQPVAETITTSPTRVYQNPLAMLTKSLREKDADHRLCSRCLLEIGLDDRILLSDRALHARCAECRVCHLNLNSLNYKELNGELFCDVHYSQEVASIRHSRRSSHASRPGTPRSQSTSGKRRTNEMERSQTSTSKPVYGTLVTSDTINTLRQIIPNGVAQNSIQRAPSDAIFRDQDHTLQAQHDELVEKLNMLNGHGSSKSMVCATCKQSVQPSMFLQLYGKKYHFGCIKCEVCSKRLSRWNYKEIDGNIYCTKHFNLNNGTDERVTRDSAGSSRSSTPRRMSVERLHCYACEESVYQTEMLNVLGRIYHRACFKCVECHSTLGVENYYVHEGEPYCKSHYTRALHSVPVHFGFTMNEIVPDGQEQNPCYECHLPVHPRDGMNVIDRFYHYGCFKCTECQELLNMGKYEVAKGQPYCEVDFLKLFGKSPNTPTRVPPHRFTEIIVQD